MADYGSLNWVCVMPDPFPTEIFKPSNTIINKIANLIQIFQPLCHTEKENGLNDNGNIQTGIYSSFVSGEMGHKLF